MRTTVTDLSVGLCPPLSASLRGPAPRAVGDRSRPASGPFRAAPVSRRRDLIQAVSVDLTLSHYKTRPPFHSICQGAPRQNFGGGTAPLPPPLPPPLNSCPHTRTPPAHRCGSGSSCATAQRGRGLWQSVPSLLWCFGVQCAEAVSELVPRGQSVSSGYYEMLSKSMEWQMEAGGTAMCLAHGRRATRG